MLASLGAPPQGASRAPARRPPRRCAALPAASLSSLLPDTGSSVRAPLSLYALLGVPPRAAVTAIDAAAAARARPPESTAEALSPAALEARAALVSLAAKTLAHPPSRVAYDAALAAGEADVDVPLLALPGALALLQARGPGRRARHSLRPFPPET